MKYLLAFAFTCCSMLSTYGQQKSQGKQDPKKEILSVEAACGQCQFKLPGHSCDLAVRINGKAYFVDGIHIDSLGDAHAKDGFCNAIRKAKVQGEVVNNRFKATYFELAPSHTATKEKL